MAIRSKKTESFDVKGKSVSGGSSVIPYLFGRGIKKVYRLASTGSIGRFLSSYDVAEKKTGEAFILKKPRLIYNKICSEKRRKNETEILPDEAQGVLIYKEETLNKKFSSSSIPIYSAGYSTSLSLTSYNLRVLV